MPSFKQGQSYLMAARNLHEISTPVGNSEFEDLDLNDTLLAVASSKRVEIWNRESGSSVKSAVIENGLVSAVALNRAGSVVALGTLSGDVRLVPLEEGRVRTLPASSLSIGVVILDAHGLGVVTLDDAGLGATTLAPDDTTVRFRDVLLRPRVARWLPAKNHVVADAPLEISSWSISRASRTARFGTTVDAWPLACAPDGLCAWEEAHDGKHTIIVPVIRQWTLRPGRELPPLPLEIRSEGLLGIDISRTWTPFTRFVVPRAGMATAVAYSADGQFLAAANDRGVHVWSTSGDRSQPVTAAGLRACLLAGLGGTSVVQCRPEP